MNSTIDLALLKYVATSFLLLVTNFFGACPASAVDSHVAD